MNIQSIITLYSYKHKPFISSQHTHTPTPQQHHTHFCIKRAKRGSSIPLFLLGYVMGIRCKKSYIVYNTLLLCMNKENKIISLSCILLIMYAVYEYHILWLKEIVRSTGTIYIFTNNDKFLYLILSIGIINYLIYHLNPDNYDSHFFRINAYVMGLYLLMDIGNLSEYLNTFIQHFLAW